MKHFFFCLLLFGLLGLFHGGHENSLAMEDPDICLSDCMSTAGWQLSAQKEFSASSHKPCCEVELNTYTLGLQHTAFSRAKRSFSLKNMLFLRSLHENTLRCMRGIYRQKEHLAITTFTPSSSSSVCTYYVYALRHIII